MTCWDVLGIAPTSDKKKIKQAYAVLLKKNKPDENPQGFSVVHSAYKESLYHAASNHQHVEEQQASLPRSSLKPDETQDDKLAVNTASSVLSETKESEAVNQQGVIQTELEKPSGLENMDEQGSSTNLSDLRHLGDPIAPIEQTDPIEQKELSDSEREVICSPYDEGKQLPVSGPQQEIINDEYVEPQPDTMDIDDYINSLDAAWGKITAASEVAMSTLSAGDDTSHWRFIDDYQEMYDFQFKEQYSSYIFSKLFDFFEKNTIKPRNRPKTIKHFGQLFSWLNQQENIEYDYGYDEVAPIFDVLLESEGSVEKKLQWLVPKRHVGLMEYANYYARLAAMVIDVIMIYMIISTLHVETEKFTNVVYSALAYILLIPIAEASPMQGSVGKVLFGMKVTGRTGKRLNIFHAYWRQLLYVIITGAFKFTVWINFFLNDGRLLHDRLSVSRVIKR